ncbi:sigma factor-like helix-turn-helix DNA-binding protein [Paenibacillus piscarius]|uniref:sigma factor-like helix-turn-helix DNA-binding protein n=1 Tax=Paenibacillus piscarius TaxID=1089681 RepID=UPI001EE8AA26|nr:sigma factor-like helix-turn-helix DNA-binding protein [Paenibacillus piscarius]
MNLTLLSKAESGLVESFFQNKENISLNPIVNSFFDDEQHIKWLVQAIKGSEVTLQLLNIAFKKYYFRIRFIHFISSTIHFATIGFMRKMNKVKERNLLYLDSDYSSNKNNKDELLFNNAPLFDHYFFGEKFFKDNIEDDTLYLAWVNLSPKQKQVIVLSYMMSYQDTEIAEFLSISPQAVFNRKRNALVKMRTIYFSGRKTSRCLNNH